MPEIADDDPLDTGTLRRFVELGQAWVAEDDEREPPVIGYLVAEVVDGCGHVAQVSVHPDLTGHRIGAGLIDTLAAWAAERGMPAVTLTTFRDVPWNAPYYERLGFVPFEAIGPELRGVVEREAAEGLDPAARVCMRRELPEGPRTLGSEH